MERLRRIISSARTGMGILQMEQEAESFKEMHKQLQADDITLMLLHLQTTSGAARFLDADDVEGIILELENLLVERASMVRQQPSLLLPSHAFLVDDRRIQSSGGGGG